MPAPYRLLLIRRPDGDALDAARAVSAWLEASGDGPAPGVAAATIDEIDALAQRFTSALPGADVPEFLREPGEYTIDWDVPVSSVELTPEYAELEVSSPRITGRGPTVESTTPLVERVHALVDIARSAGFDLAYDPVQDRLISFPADAGVVEDWMNYTVADDIAAKRRKASDADPSGHPYVPYHLVQFSSQGTSDLLAEGRRLAASALARPVGELPAVTPGIDPQRVVDAVTGEVECETVLWSSARDQVAIVPIDEGGWFWATPAFVVVGSLQRSIEPVNGGKTLASLTLLTEGPGLDAVYDPQLDRLVTFPDDRDSISAEWSSRFRTAMADAGFAGDRATDAENAANGRDAANAALGRGASRGGLFSRLFGR